MQKLNSKRVDSFDSHEEENKAKLTQSFPDTEVDVIQETQSRSSIPKFDRNSLRLNRGFLTPGQLKARDLLPDQAVTEYDSFFEQSQIDPLSNRQSIAMVHTKGAPIHIRMPIHESTTNC